MRDLVAYSEAVTAGDVNNALTGVSGTGMDDFLDGSNNHAFPRPWGIEALYVQGASLTRARLNFPSARRIVLPQIRPISVAATPPANPNLQDLRGMEIPVRAEESVAVETTNNLGMGTERHTCGVFLSDGGRPPSPSDPSGRWWLRATGTTTLTTFAWTNVPLTFDETPPPGLYQIYGLVVQSAGAILARVVASGYSNRPGAVAITALGNRSHDMFEQEDLDYGQFRTLVLPSVEILSSSADTAEVAFLKIGRVGG